MIRATFALTGAPACLFAAAGRPRPRFPLCREGWTELYLETGDERPLQRDLVIEADEDMEQIPTLDLSDAIFVIEDKVIETLRPLLPPGRRAQCILGFPGRSKTDPLYALRLLEKTRAITGKPGYLTVYDQDNHSLTRRYYEETLPLATERFFDVDSDDPHTLIANWGIQVGAVEYARPQLGHLAMALMPGRHFELVTTFFKTVLAKGGVAIWAHDYGVEHGDWQALHSEMMEVVQRDFTLLADPLVPSPFKTPFSARYSQNEAMLLQKKT